MESGVKFNREEVLKALHKRGHTLKSWCEKEGYPYRIGTDVLRGAARCYYGKSREMGLKFVAMVKEGKV